MSQYIIHDHNDDGIDRQGFLKSLARADTRSFCVLKSRVLKSCSLRQLGRHGASSLKGELSFVRIGDNLVGVGFNKPTNPEVTASASLRPWLVQAHTNHVTREGSEPCEWRVAGNIQ
jgi:hypothetical protein